MTLHILHQTFYSTRHLLKQWNKNIILHKYSEHQKDNEIIQNISKKT